jgi:hypothetical protein
MDVTYIDSKGCLQIDCLYFLDVIRSVGMYITITSAFFYVCELVGGYDVKFFAGCFSFGFALMMEGTIASFFKIGD